ncbi:hypothetical protein GGR52DRAFT_72301 [Hypoxylon sp. FL1284]|nr:hypothetical protein GGR52DRAFT_72301 [Hypoxylon sp. FL1284]
MSAAGRAVWWRQIRFFTTPTTSPASRTRSSIHAPTPPFSLLPFLRRSRAPHLHRRLQSTKPNPQPATAEAEAAARSKTHQRADAIVGRASRWVPSRLRPYLARLRSAPLSHVAAFLALHELTALAPLLGLSYLFHALDWVPTAWVLGPWAAWAEEGLRRYLRYFRRKGWFGLTEEGDGEGEGEQRLEERLRDEARREEEREATEGRVGAWLALWRRRDGDGGGDDVPEEREKSKTAAAWQKAKKAVTVDHTEKGYKIGVQIAAAYAITKMLLIPRIALSLWATPWLARVFVRARRSVWRKST